MSFDALGVHDVVIKIGIIGIDSRRGNLGYEKPTPGHDLTPSLSPLMNPLQGLPRPDAGEVNLL
jgi:hypothetical protein